ncbi:MAG: hypothetical protein CM1200mP39_10360 [Dehalococcoidia bacterium]|nr:MAG: hypothetical protein CM1200mP39_10360 [Dehalococcoidia bacterium]
MEKQRLDQWLRTHRPPSFRSLKQRHPDTIEVVAINDVGETETNGHLLKFDSTYGAPPGNPLNEKITH